MSGVSISWDVTNEGGGEHYGVANDAVDENEDIEDIIEADPDGDRRTTAAGTGTGTGTGTGARKTKDGSSTEEEVDLDAELEGRQTRQT